MGCREVFTEWEVLIYLADALFADEAINHVKKKISIQLREFFCLSEHQC